MLTTHNYSAQPQTLFLSPPKILHIFTIVEIIRINFAFSHRKYFMNVKLDLCNYSHTQRHSHPPLSSLPESTAAQTNLLPSCNLKC